MEWPTHSSPAKKYPKNNFIEHLKANLNSEKFNFYTFHSCTIKGFERADVVRFLVNLCVSQRTESLLNCWHLARHFNSKL